MPEVYAPTVAGGEPEHSTYYQVFAGSGSLFGHETGTKFHDLKDGTGTPLMVVGAARPVPWTKPEDVPFDLGRPLPELSRPLRPGFCAGFADGPARFLPRTIAPETIKALITPGGQEVIKDADF